MSVFRPNTDNDANYAKDWMNKYFLQLASEQLESYEIKKTNNNVKIVMHKYFSCLSQSWGYFVDYEYSFFNDGRLVINIKGKDSQIGKLEPKFFPRLGIVMNINKDYKDVTYFGRGPLENYPDSKECSYLDIFKTNVNKLFVNYIFQVVLLHNY